MSLVRVQFASPLTMTRTPFDPTLGKGTNPSRTKSTSSGVVSNSSRSNRLNTAAIVRNNSAYARLVWGIVSQSFACLCEECSMSYLMPKQLRVPLLKDVR